MDLGITLSKVLPLLVYPLNLAIWLGLIGLLVWLFGKRRLAALSLTLALTILIVAASPKVAGTLYRNLERQYLPVAVEKSPSADVIVLLGGAISGVFPPRVTSDLSGAADRVLHAARLYRAGKAPVIITSGGNIFPQEHSRPESDLIAELLQEWGVKPTDIIIENQSRNTFENARQTKYILEKRKLKRVLLVTSALHMPRAMAIFKTAGVDVVPSPTDFHMVDNYNQPTVLTWVPNIGALAQTTAVIREYLGHLVYRWRGWID